MNTLFNLETFTKEMKLFEDKFRDLLFETLSYSRNSKTNPNSFFNCISEIIAEVLLENIDSIYDSYKKANIETPITQEQFVSDMTSIFSSVISGKVSPTLEHNNSSNIEKLLLLKKILPLNSDFIDKAIVKLSQDKE